MPNQTRAWSGAGLAVALVVGAVTVELSGGVTLALLAGAAVALVGGWWPYLKRVRCARTPFWPLLYLGPADDKPYIDAEFVRLGTTKRYEYAVRVENTGGVPGRFVAQIRLIRGTFHIMRPIGYTRRLRWSQSGSFEPDLHPGEPDYVRFAFAESREGNPPGGTWWTWGLLHHSEGRAQPVAADTESENLSPDGEWSGEGIPLTMQVKITSEPAPPKGNEWVRRFKVYRDRCIPIWTDR